MTRRQWVCLTVAGAVSGLMLMVLAHQPIRVQHCAVQAVGGSALTCDDRRTWDWPDLENMALASIAGAFVIGGLALPFMDRRSE